MTYTNLQAIAQKHQVKSIRGLTNLLVKVPYDRTTQFPLFGVLLNRGINQNSENELPYELRKGHPMGLSFGKRTDDQQYYVELCYRLVQEAAAEKPDISNITYALGIADMLLDEDFEIKDKA